MQKNLPFITIGIPTRNSERTISACLKSIINSNYDEAKMEIIVVDGKSEDRTMEIVMKYKQSAEKRGIAFKVLSDEGRGLGYARQLVVENARGEYIVWVDSDCMISRDLIKTQVDMVKSPSVGMAVPLVLPTGKSLVERLQGYAWLLPTLNAIRTGKTPYITMSGSITPLRALKSVGGFNTSLRVGEDVDIASKLRAHGFKVVANERAIVYHYTRKTLKDFLKHVAWYGRDSPRRSLKGLLKEVILRTILYTKLAFLAVKTLRDYACILIPLFIVLWNAIYVASCLTSER